tara:strand:+ start:64 stop:294 length:231 start_codon:yes stop_codon:yes gene_type:complete
MNDPDTEDNSPWMHHGDIEEGEVVLHCRLRRKNVKLLLSAVTFSAEHLDYPESEKKSLLELKQFLSLAMMEFGLKD